MGLKFALFDRVLLLVSSEHSINTIMLILFCSCLQINICIVVKCNHFEEGVGVKGSEYIPFHKVQSVFSQPSIDTITVPPLHNFQVILIAKFCDTHRFSNYTIICFMYFVHGELYSRYLRKFNLALLVLINSMSAFWKTFIQVSYFIC
jgi:hypothetical protein